MSHPHNQPLGNYPKKKHNPRSSYIISNPAKWKHTSHTSRDDKIKSNLAFKYHRTELPHLWVWPYTIFTIEFNKIFIITHNTIIQPPPPHRTEGKGWFYECGKNRVDIRREKTHIGNWNHFPSVVMLMMPSR